MSIIAPNYKTSLFAFSLKAAAAAAASITTRLTVFPAE